MESFTDAELAATAIALDEMIKELTVRMVRDGHELFMERLLQTKLAREKVSIERVARWEKWEEDAPIA